MHEERLLVDEEAEGDDEMCESAVTDDKMLTDDATA
jgi:hypothetical protein